MRSSAFAIAVGAYTFLVTVIWGAPFIEVLHIMKVGKQIRADIQDKHEEKRGTPTMGGLLIIIPTVIVTIGLNLATLALPGLTGRSILLPVAVLIYFGVLGAIDDIEGIRGARAEGEGLSAPVKFALQIIGGLGATLFIYYGLDIHYVILPGLPFRFDLGYLFIPIGVFWINGFSNAVNLTDGLDGLAGIITASAFAGIGVIAALQDQIYLVQFCFIIVGSCFAFLWFNAHPAQLFMGDTGSLALGATLATVALMSGQWLVLPVIAIVPVAETLSVIIQVISARFSRRYLGRDIRPFKRTPLHHHYEMVGWSETQIVQRFWLIAILATLFGVALAII